MKLKYASSTLIGRPGWAIAETWKALFSRLIQQSLTSLHGLCNYRYVNLLKPGNSPDGEQARHHLALIEPPGETILVSRLT
jgi:hypothetical protein